MCLTFAVTKMSGLLEMIFVGLFQRLKSQTQATVRSEATNRDYHSVLGEGGGRCGSVATVRRGGVG